MSNVDGLGSMLKSITSATTLVNSPPSEVTISLAGVSELVAETKNFLRIWRIRLPRAYADDEENFHNTVIQLQVYAKAAYARRKVSVDTSNTDYELVKQVTSLFKEGLKSTAAYIDNIGAFEIAGQCIVPALPPNPLPHPLLVDGSWVRSVIRTPEGYMYVHNGEDPIDPNDVDAVLALPAARRRVITGHVASLNKLFEQYNCLLQRVYQKLPRAIVKIDLASGKGTAAQIVGCRESEGESYAWCHRFVSKEIMLLGAGCKFGYNNEADEWHKETQIEAQTYRDLFMAFPTKLMELNMQGYECRYSDSDSSDSDSSY